MSPPLHMVVSLPSCAGPRGAFEVATDPSHFPTAGAGLGRVLASGASPSGLGVSGGAWGVLGPARHHHEPPAALITVSRAHRLAAAGQPAFTPPRGVCVYL